MTLPRPGQVIANRYEVAEELGRGRASAIVKAFDLHLARRVVAIKILLSPDPAWTAAFDREAGILAHLNHPGIPRFYDRLVEHGRLHLVLEYIPGTRLDPSQHATRIAPLAARVLHVLEHLHEQQPPVVHADVKPENILVSTHDDVSLIDFGAAQAGAQPQGPQLLTSAYASPEQAGGGAPRPAWDLWAVGVILHQFLAGMLPQRGPDGTIPIPATIPASLAPLVQRALDPNPRNRWRTARDFRAALERAQIAAAHEAGCSQCGRRHAKGVFFCYACGNALDGDGQAPPSTPLPVSVRRIVSQPLKDGLKKPKERGADPLLLGVQAEALARPADFDTLMSLDHIDIEEMPHQVRAVKTALKAHRGRSLLADEVGLGKTIEAGLVLSELKLRGLVRNVLVLVPSHLTPQWQEEMKEKFRLSFGVYAAAEARDIARASFVIASIRGAAGTRNDERLRNALCDRRWDLVIVDEAHHARNRRTRVWSLLQRLQKNYFLLLTATPMHNDLEELYNLANLVQQGLLGNTVHEFNARYGVNGRTVRHEQRLRKDLEGVMVRTRRSEAYVRFPERRAVVRRLDPRPAEKALYEKVTQHVRSLAREPGGMNPLLLIVLQQRLTSSPEAVAESLRRMSGHHPIPGALIAEAEQLRGTSSKVDTLLEILTQVNDRVVVFTDHIPTQEMLRKRLATQGFDTQVYSGRGSEGALQHFIRKGRVLVVGQSGNEGLNLHQWCHVLVNFDLPWNPMRVEQRIGRLQRLGQRRDVLVFNLSLKDTVEDQVLAILQDKIRLFEMSIGQVDLILGEELSDEGSFRDRVWKCLLQADNPAQLGRLLDEQFTQMENRSDDRGALHGLL